MSKHEFKTRYIFGASQREATLAVSLAFLCGSSLAVIAAVPGVDEARKTAEIVGGLNAQELLAAVCLGALALAGYCVKALMKQGRDATKALTEIADKMKSMKCVKEG